MFFPGRRIALLAAAALAAAGVLTATEAVAATARYEAEGTPATCDGTIDSNYAGYSGSGFCNGNNAIGAAAQFTVSAAAAGTASVAVRYANGTTANRPADVVVNGTVAHAATAFDPTGAWATWATKTLAVSLNAGSNTIRLRPTTTAGLPNIDYVDVTAGDTSPSLTPVLVTTVDTAAAGGGARPLLGDVNDDGRLDMVVVQPDYLADDRYVGHQVQAVTAYDFTRGRLWQVGRPDPRVTNSGSDIPAEVYDFDADGHNDVVAAMGGQIRVLDGRTGAVKQTIALPNKDAHDTIIFADFRGNGRPRELVLKDRYSNMWALDRSGAQLWRYAGTTGHRPYPHDFDGDGRQELIGGYEFLTPDGRRLWHADMADHPDSIAVGDLNGDGIEEIAFGGAGKGGDSINVYEPNGTRLWQNFDAVEAQQIAFGDFRPDLPGLEVAGLDRVDRSTNGKDAMFVIDARGRTVWKENRSTTGCWGTAVEGLHNWAGDYADHILAWSRGCGSKAGIYDGTGKLLATFPVDGRMMRGDVCGDDRTEVVDYVMGSTAYLYANGPCDLSAKVTGRPLPQVKRLYNYSRYTAEEIPANLAAGRTPTTGGAQVNLDLGRLRELTGYRITWTGGRVAHRVEVSADGSTWVPAVPERTPVTTDRQNFTGLGRYVRVSATDGQTPLTIQKLEVFGTR